MKLARYVRAGIGVGALTMAGAALIGTAAPAAAAIDTPHGGGTSAAQAMTAWVAGPGYRYLNATDAAEDARNGRALAHYASLAAEYPQPVDTAAYVAMMREYVAAGIALSRGEAATAKAELGIADEMAWDVIQDTFAVLGRVRITG